MRTTILLLAAAFLFGMAVFWFGERLWAAPAGRGVIIRQNGFQFISPILACEIAADKTAFVELNPVRKDIQAAVDSALGEGRAKNISVYLRMLNSGRWLGIHEEERYAPASLMKVLVMMALYQNAESDPSALARTIEAPAGTASAAPLENYPEAALHVGERYTVDELIRRMIVYSSNEALNLLLDHLSPAELVAMKDVYSDLNIKLPEKFNEETLDFMSPKAYSLVFRVLYGSTYLDHDMSERVLKLLSGTAFREGIAAGAPDAVPVAHKFGIRSVPSGDELHDCGIIYYPEHPFLLCVMTRGDDFRKLNGVIADISRSAYARLDRFFSSAR